MFAEGEKKKKSYFTTVNGFQPVFNISFKEKHEFSVNDSSKPNYMSDL